MAGSWLVFKLSPRFFEDIKDKQFKDENMNKLKEKKVKNKAKYTNLDKVYSALQGRIFVARVDELIKKLFDSKI